MLEVRDTRLLPGRDTVEIRFKEGYAVSLGMIQHVEVMLKQVKERGTWWNRIRSLRALVGVRVQDFPERLVGVLALEDGMGCLLK
jgi:hypothetical protein